MNGSTYAFIGDAVMALWVKTYLVELGYRKSDELQRLSVLFLSAKAQAAFAQHCLDQALFSNEVHAVYLRGRNHKSVSMAKNTDVITYRIATGLEAVWGYLYLEKQENNLREIWEEYKNFVKEKHETIFIR